MRFATNTLVLAVSPKSQFAERLTPRKTGGARSVSPDVRVGLSDPRFDAAGYRGLMALQLAEQHYGDPYIFEDVVLGQFTSPVTSEAAGDGHVIHVPEVLETRPDSRLALRGGSVSVLALLESGDVDCAFEYESVALQHDLPYAVLPAAVNLGDPGHRDAYRRVSVVLDYRRFASVRPMFRGDVIYYGFTVPANAPSPSLADEFVAFLLGADGQRVLAATAQPVVSPAVIDEPSAAPEEVRRACELSR